MQQFPRRGSAASLQSFCAELLTAPITTMYITAICFRL
jgi:hypothetical protein